MPGRYGRSRFGLEVYGGSPEPFGLTEALALNPITVRVSFNALVDLSHPNLVDDTKYVLAPATDVSHVFIETASSVLLRTDPLTDGLYVLTVSDIVSRLGRVLDPNPAEVSFRGYLKIGFRPQPVSAYKVRLLFNRTMHVNTALTSASSYRVTYLDGTVIPVVRAEAEGPPDAPVAVALTVYTPMPSSVVLLAVVASAEVQTVDGHPITDNVQDFRWIAGGTRTTIPCTDFSGEAQIPLLGSPAGQVFFSPALTAHAPRSSIQVREVSVCTRAYDIYAWPEKRDPSLLFTFKPGVAQNTLCSVGSVLFAGFEQLTDARIDLHDYQEDAFDSASDSRCIATVTEILDPTRVARLNGINWPLFDGISTTPFISAANLTPIPPGTTTIRALET